MKKAMMLAATLAMVFTAASPVMAQDSDDDINVENSGNDNSDNSSTDVQYQSQECQIVFENIQSGDANADQDAGDDGQYAGDGTSLGDDGAAAGGDAVGGDTAQEISQDTGIDINVVQQCIQAGGDASGVIGGGADGADGDDGVDGTDGSNGVDTDGDGVADDYNGDGVADDAAAAEGAVAGDDASAAYSVLPDTGGASLIALGAGALLVAGGLLARRIVR